MDIPKDNFPEWYNEVIERAKLVDKRYPVKGMHVWLPYGWKLMRNIDEYFRKIFTEHNHEEVYFPLLVPETDFKKEGEHIRGLENEVYWVTHGGATPLDVKLVLRPTSETAMYPLFSLWIRTHADLPLRIFQIVNVFRYETKQTRTFIRVREVHFFESHTAHATAEESEEQIRENIEIWKKVAKKLALPYVLVKKADWDKFPGAHYSIGAETIMPSGRTLQIATIHQYLQNFAKAYDIKYLKEDGTHDYVHQTTFGMSERLVGAIVGIHGDNRGLVIPPEIAPIQIVIVPIIMKEKERILEEAKKIEDELKPYYRVYLDDRDNYTPGYKFYEWELKGVPLRLEIGPRDLENNQVVLVRRDTFEKINIGREEYMEKIGELLKEIQENLLRRAEKEMREKIKKFENLEEVKEHKGIAVVNWCGSEECGHKIEELTDKKIIGIPQEKRKGICAICGKETDIVAYVAKPY
ncbi:MAG: proline--tRNA ligase [Thermoplasmata archaeon]|nr:proline--tRNA ligase [Thermoplasmata archaeon]